jgi:hypothetical protein
MARVRVPERRRLCRPITVRQRIMTTRPSPLERLLATASGRISCLLDYALDDALPRIRPSLAILDAPGQSADQLRSAHQNVRCSTRVVGSLCRASKNGRMSAEHRERYRKVLQRFRPMRRRIERAGVQLSSAILSEIERNLPSRKRPTGPRLYVLEVLRRLLQGWFGLPREV